MYSLEIKQYDLTKRDNKKDKSLTLKSTQSDDKEDGLNMAYLTRTFQNIVRKHGDFRKKGNTGKTFNNVELCYGCRKSKHYCRKCP